MQLPLSAPFDWCAIPAGQVTLTVQDYLFSDGTPITAPAFTLSQYPITNGQYAQFIAAGGYHNQGWWTEAGWTFHQGMGWDEPAGWSDVTDATLDHPVLGVTWYEAIAFCRWLHTATARPITLPSEAQWQRAAQGEDARPYSLGYGLGLHTL